MNTLTKTSIGRPRRRLELRFILIGLALGSVGLSQGLQAVIPAPDGGYPGGNTAEGQGALFSLTSGTYNTAVGLFSLRNNTEGQFNTAIGAGALLSNTTGSVEGIVNSSQNTATGAGALLSNTTGSNNTAIGAFALFSNTTFGFNTATGSNALFANTTGVRNTANGAFALAGNTTSVSNTAAGTFALFTNTEGGFNTAFGDNALYSNINGNGNTATGYGALLNNSSGGANTANGDSALANNTIGTGNIALGFVAGSKITTANNVICIGAAGENVDNSCFISQVYTNVQPVIGIDPDYVTIDTAGRLGRSNLNGSSRQFKHDIKPMDKASEVIFTLKPVSFRFNKEYDAMQRIGFGLIAEEVAEVAPDLVGRNKRGEPDSVRYEQVNAMLLNEFLKEHRKVEDQWRELHEQQATITELKSTVAQHQKSFAEQEKQIKALQSGLQKVSVQLDTTKPVAQMVLSNR